MELAPVIGGTSLIQASKDRIGALLSSPSPFKKELIELDYSGNIRGKWDFTNNLDKSWQPVAFLSDSTLYANRLATASIHGHSGARYRQRQMETD